MKRIKREIVLLVIYINDLIVTGDNDANINEMKVLLKKKFKRKDLGELYYFLDIEISRAPNGIWLLQRQ